jgi:hypothetical protein
MEQKLILTNHCKARMQQRGVPEMAVFLLRKFGKSINTHGSKKFFCNKKIINKLNRNKETRHAIKKFTRHLLTTAIVCNGSTCITVMKINENKRLRWN